MEFAAVAFKPHASFHFPQNGWFGFTTDFNEIIRFHERCSGVGVKANAVEEQGGQLPCINGAAHWPVTAMQLTDSLCCREALRSIPPLPCMQTAPLFI